jgi:hypothetical protein
MPSENPAEPIANAALKRLRFTAACSAVISTSCASLKCSCSRANSSSLTCTGVRITATEFDHRAGLALRYSVNPCHLRHPPVTSDERSWR